MPIYVFDASAWIELWRRYPPTVFPLLWQKFRDMSDAGELFSPDEVLKELQNYLGDPVLPSTLKVWPNLFRPLDGPLQTQLSVVMASYGGLVSVSAPRGRADPVVVALATISGAAVVTMEKRRKNPTDPPKIPDACDGFGLTHLDVLGLIPRLGLAL